MTNFVPAPRTQTDTVGRIARDAVTAIVAVLCATARCGADAVRQLRRAIGAVPPALRVLALVGIAMLLGMVGAMALPDGWGLICLIVVTPLCSMTLGALGYRWYAGPAGRPVPRADAPEPDVSAPELRRSVEYVDRKLTDALHAFGADHHQHAMIALFQAKTAVEFTLGTEQDQDSQIGALLSAEGRDARPRIRAGSATPLHEGSSLAAS